jgi:hypothetical protein
MAGMAEIFGAAALAGVGFFLRRMMSHRLRPGAPIVYRMVATSTCPGPEAREVHPAKKGELYYYLTNKYWRVEEVRTDGSIVARTPLMEQHILRRGDPNLRKAGLLERLRYGSRFPVL